MEKIQEKQTRNQKTETVFAAAFICRLNRSEKCDKIKKKKRSRDMDQMYDVIIIGGGAAAASAVLTLKNRGKSVAVVSNR